jgi:uncharacterized protein (TIGR00369 family)
MSFKKISESETTITELMIPSYANFGGKVHGGFLLSLMDKVAYVVASKHSGGYCVTVAVENVEFLTPVEVGELVSMKASVNYVGRTTMIVGIRVESLQPKTGVVKHTNSSYFTMAAKDDNDDLKAVPGLILENKTELRRFCEGRLIRDFSKQKRDILKSDMIDVPYEGMVEMCQSENCNITFI